ncbi:MAG TPA: response regulator [Verrucomicrobiae bacterium]|jgi:CheY-like chemotaxis protein|nr:response regulator [Verrucomicrobiae bacterium]
MTEVLPRPVILLVDDNPHDVVLIRLAFRRVGIIDTIHLVKDGLEAMRYIKGEGAYADRIQFPVPTLILLDLKMPQTSGFDVLQWIREHPELSSIVVVVMSGSNNDEDIGRAYDLGANSYLIKPTRFEDMVRMMESLKDYTHWRKNARVAGSARSKQAFSSDSMNAALLV